MSGPSRQGKVIYAEGWRILNLANEVCGFNGWSSSITSLAVDYVCTDYRDTFKKLTDLMSFQIDCNEQTQWYCVGVTSIVKVTLYDGVSHEDVGFGMLDNCRQNAWPLTRCTFLTLLPYGRTPITPLITSCSIQCKKFTVTDSLKRTLRNFGNLLGNCLYDRSMQRSVYIHSM